MPIAIRNGVLPIPLSPTSRFTERSATNPSITNRGCSFAISSLNICGVNSPNARKLPFSAGASIGAGEFISQQTCPRTASLVGWRVRLRRTWWIDVDRVAADCGPELRVGFQEIDDV